MAVVAMRLVLKPTGADEVTAEDKQIVLDLNVDEATNVSTGPFPAWGRIGDFRKAETLVPFTLMMDGRLDTGAYATDAQRQDFLDIRKAELGAGKTVVLRSGDEATEYEVAKITPLIG